MNLYSYVIPRDYGFAPNPYFDYCTLATCKPLIRRHAQKGDWVAAVGSLTTEYAGKLVMLMKVDETLSFDEYWEDERFKRKRPVRNKGMMHMHGDNIYHHEGGEWIQEFSHHSKPNGDINYDTLTQDTATDRVLIATEYYYFGDKAVDIPVRYQEPFQWCRGYRKCEDEALIDSFVKYMRKKYQNGIHGTPYSRRKGGFAHYKGR